MVLSHRKHQRYGYKKTVATQTLEALETRRLLAATLFSANFEDVSGTGGFTIDSPATNIWHSTTLASQSPTHSMYYGIDATQTYSTVDGSGNPTANAGTITSPAISLSGHAAADLRFRYFLNTENSGPISGEGYDVAKVQITSDNGTTWSDVATNQDTTMPDTNGWSLFSTNLNAYAGSTVKLRFSFDTFDEAANNYIGWFVDDVVVSDPQGNPAPEITAVSPAYGTTISATTASIDVTFSKAVTGVDASALLLSGAGGAAVVGTPTQNGNVYTFPVSGLQTGTLTATIATNGKIKDAANQVVLPVTTKYAVLLPDRFETNDTFATATNLGTVASHTESGLSIHSASDVDYFKFTPDATGPVTISTKGNLFLGDLSLFVYDSTQTQIAMDDGTSGAPTDLTDTRTVTLASATAGQTYYIEVTGFSNDVVNDYALTVTAASKAPQVTGVYVRGSTWASSLMTYLQTKSLGDSVYGYAIPTGTSQLRNLPWGNIDRISVKFSEDVGSVSKAQVALLGGRLGAIDLTSATLSYNATTFVATLTLPSALARDKFMYSLNADGAAPITDLAGVKLDGEFTNSTGTFPSGDGTPGGNFNFRIDVLPGDTNDNDVTQPTDTAAIKLAINQNTGSATYSIFADLNGNGVVQPTDVTYISANKNLGLGGITAPTAPVFSASPLVAAATSGQIKIAIDLLGTLGDNVLTGKASALFA